jgi:hypothetical protein
MRTAAGRRAAVRDIMLTADVSERRACRFTGFARSTQRYRPTRDDTALRERLVPSQTRSPPRPTHASGQLARFQVRGTGRSAIVQRRYCRYPPRAVSARVLRGIGRTPGNASAAIFCTPLAIKKKRVAGYRRPSTFVLEPNYTATFAVTPCVATSRTRTMCVRRRFTVECRMAARFAAITVAEFRILLLSCTCCQPNG